MGRIKRGAVSMPKRRKRQRTIISDAETSAVPVQEAAEVPPVEPEVACQPVLPTRVHSSLSSSKWPSISASMRKLARFRKDFAKIELYWNRRRMVENRTLDAFRDRDFAAKPLKHFAVLQNCKISCKMQNFAVRA